MSMAQLNVNRRVLYWFHDTGLVGTINVCATYYYRD